MRGRIVRINKDKGFFFIKSDEGGPDRFAHMSALRNADFEAIREGDFVYFEDTITEKGPRAERVFFGDGPANDFEALFK